MAQKSTPKKAVAEDPRYTQALQSYEAGLRFMQEHKFDKAKPHFQKVLAGPIKELADRTTVHLNICNQHLDRATATQFKTPERILDTSSQAVERRQAVHHVVSLCILLEKLV